MRLPRLLCTAGVVVLSAAGLALGGAVASSASTADTYPVTSNLAEGVAQSASDPAAPPPGVNVSGCQPSSAHPIPVVLVDGTFANMTDDWSGLGPVLANAGYCVYSTPLGAPSNSLIQTTGPAADSAQELASFVDSVLSETGAGQVDLVGHSQGGMLSEYYTKVLGGAAKVHTLVGLSPTTHGTTLDGLGTLAQAFPGGSQIVGTACPACADQLTGSTVIQTLDNGAIAQSGVNYTIIETRNETVVTPAGSSFINEPGVTNEWVQDSCASDTVDHASLPYDKTVQLLTENALDPGDPQAVTC
ncbi:MAG TPA: alpha/beta fold hydrolase [Pseudonocardiaceae bacterium]|jgi:triacylglycerol esterase/lipase EstA (alpha/beta hydrolase family)|nr:alpha/beta fold hydrolase [Pseudonocardiaceae bacterium]